MAGSGGGFFGGLLEGVGGALLDAKQEQHKAQIEQNKTLASVLLKGLDADPTRETASAVLPKVAELLHEPVQTLFGIKLGKAGGKGGSQLSQMFEGVAASFPTRDELQERETKAAAAKAGATAGATVTGRGEAQAKLSDLLLSTGRAKTREEANQMAGLKEPTALRPPTEGSRGAFINGALADAEATKGEKLTPAEEQQVRTKATQDFAEKSKAPAASQGPGTFADVLKRTETEKGRSLTAKELVGLENEWARAHAQETPAEKLQRAQSIAKYRTSLQEVTDPQAFAADVKTTTTDRKYLDLSSYDVKSRQKARDWANKNGVTPVSKEQAASLGAVDTARLNQSAMRDMLLSKLPTDPVQRPLVAAKNTIAQMAQTDPDLAAFPAWRESAIQQVRAMQGQGSGQYRLTQQMVNLIINNDIPQPSDTVATALRKFDVVKKQLDDVEDSITVRDRKTLLPGGSNERPVGGSTIGVRPDASVPDDITQRLKTAPAAKYHDTKTDTYWIKAPDGTLKKITKAEYDR